MSLLAATQTARRISAHSSNVVPGQAVEAATYKISRDRPGRGPRLSSMPPFPPADLHAALFHLSGRTK